MKFYIYQIRVDFLKHQRLDEIKENVCCPILQVGMQTGITFLEMIQNFNDGHTL